VSFSRHLLVDGANVLRAWPDARSLVTRDRAAARTLLIHRLAPIHDGEQIRLTIVFDGRGSELVVERPSNQLTFSVIYTPSALTADDVIEQMVANSADPKDCLVATDDRAERETVLATGATTLSASDLALWAERAGTQITATLATRRQANARTWQNRDSARRH